jgi:hypothetical protein
MREVLGGGVLHEPTDVADDEGDVRPTLQENWALPTAKILCHLPKVGQSANIFFADRF